ncbi:MAG: tetratricopeptide repeat protein [Myxococcales bacterium]|nr:tetratricopeptide repeat protein [Myxococcales bacterium]
MLGRLLHAERARLARWISVGFAVCVTVAPGVAFAADGDADGAKAQSEVNAVANETSSIQAAIEKAKGERYTVEQRLTNGELLYRTKDYARATVVFSEILEEFPDTPSYVDALWLRGETFYAQKEYLSARRDYRQIVDRGNEPRFSPYLGRALAGLPPDIPRVLLAHQPPFFNESQGRVALQLSGHTHGGQINPGFRPAAAVMDFVAGRYDRAGSILYVNRGFGVTGPPARVAAAPEITKLVLLAG